MTATTNNNHLLSYRELQTKLKELRDKGYNVQCKLNAKAEVLQAELDRIIQTIEAEAQQLLDSTTHSCGSESETVEVCPVLTDSSTAPYPFSNNTVQVWNNVEYRTTHLPAMNPATSSSWLTKPHKVYWVDGVDYLPFELEQKLQSMVASGTNICELTDNCPVQTENGKALDENNTLKDSSGTDKPSVDTSQLNVAVLFLTVLVYLSVQAYRVIRPHWQHYIAQQDCTIQQAVSNAAWLTRTVCWFLCGFLRLG